ncbi:MAG: hypothetical protein HYX63_23920 [Gammaproteobacteria bacterium]|nr:hypothetical protein [Gammaproteobacteria bacterium]
MRQLMWTTLLIGMAATTSVAAAQMETRCRIDGAFIKVYGDNESEQRKNCERQGGVLAEYMPHESQRQEFGERERRAGSHPGMSQMPGGGAMGRY